MVAAQTPNLVSAPRDFGADDLGNSSSRQSLGWLTRPSWLPPDNSSDFEPIDGRTFDGSIGRELTDALKRAQILQETGTSKLDSVSSPIASNKMAPRLSDPVFLESLNGGHERLDDASLNSFHTRDRLELLPKSPIAGEEPNSTLSRKPSNALTTAHSLSTRIEQAPAPSPDTSETNITARLPWTPSSNRQIQTSGASTTSSPVGHDDGSFARPSLEKDERSGHDDGHIRDSDSIQQTIGQMENALQETIEVSQKAADGNDSLQQDLREENTNLKPLFLEPQSPRSLKRRVRRRGTKDYHDVLYGIGSEDGPLSRQSSLHLDDLLPPPARASSVVRLDSVPSDVPSEEPPAFEEPEQTLKRPAIATRHSHMSSNDGADTGSSGDRFTMSPRLERRRTCRSSSSDSNIHIPLRMEEDECDSISYSLKPDKLSVLGKDRTPQVTPSPRRSSDEEMVILPMREPKVAFSSVLESVTPEEAAQGSIEASGFDRRESPQSEQRKFASKLLLRHHGAERFELGRNHPANSVFVGDSIGIDQAGDANATDPEDSPESYGRGTPAGARPDLPPRRAPEFHEMQSLEASDTVPDRLPGRSARQGYTLRNRRHFSLEPHRPFNMSKAHKRAPIARDWSTVRKRFVAAVACISTALMGLVIGIYAGEVPAIQYAVVDQHHQVILGNVVFFFGLAIPTTLLYPLPLLHGRKPYTLAALAVLLPLQFPPAVIVAQQRSPDLVWYRVGLLLSRGLAGIAMGFANFNFFSTLLDLFGSSLMSSNPHQETVIDWDPRRHGGGMGIWLGIWTWCFIGSIGLGFFIGAVTVSGLNVAWGFWVIIVLTVIVLILNVVAPEVRRSAYRKSMAEVTNGDEVSRRVARGEVMMHLYSTGPLHWWEEVLAGIRLNGRMLKQPGFLIMAVYIGWMYAQVVLVIILLGALTSRYYRFYPQTVALCVAAVPLGALLAVPFQKAGIFSRSRRHPARTDSMTWQKRVTRSSHMIRRTVFMVALPLAGVAYTLASAGPPTPAVVPSILAGLVGFLSTLALSECVGLIMETFDVSDLQPGMTGRRRSVVPEADLRRRANYSCFPRVVSGLACAQGIAFVLAAVATAAGGRVERAVGAQMATGIVAGILLLLTLALFAALTRFKSVQVVPRDRLRSEVLRGPGEVQQVVIGHPSGFDRRVSWLELGHWARWQEIRRRNGLA